MVTVTDQVYSYHYNAIGSTAAMTDQNQNVVNAYSYNSFGRIMNQIETVPQPFKYVGQYGVMAEPNGFYYMRARYYDPKTGRFISEDPIGFEGGTVNLYEYVGGQPVNLIDPLGLEKSAPEATDNGNLLPGYDAQDMTCSAPAGILNKSSCANKCCILHDLCYMNFRCNASSWPRTANPKSCQICNWLVMGCIAKCARDANCNYLDDLYDKDTKR